MQTATPGRSLDRRGRSITTFVAYDAAAELRQMAEGEVLEVLTDEFEPFERDLAAWCDATGHVVLASEAVPEGHRAALEGIDVHLYFQGPAVRVLTEGYRPKLSGWARPFSRFAAAGMTRSGHIPAQEKLRQLRSLGAHIYVCGGSMQPFKVRPEDLIFDDLPIVEYLTFVPLMEDADIQLYV